MATSKEKIVEELVNAGATPQIAATGAQALEPLLVAAPDKNDYLTEFNNAIQQKWNDVHGSATIFDRFRTTQTAPTLQAVVYEKIAPIDFSWKSEEGVGEWVGDELPNAKKVPKIHSILKSIDTQIRFKTTSSQLELSKMQVGQDVAVDNIVSNLVASYGDDRTDAFTAAVNAIDSNKTADEVVALATKEDVSSFIQKLKRYTYDFKFKRTDKYNAYTDGAGGKSDTKLLPGDRPVVFIDPSKMYKIEGDYYATLYRLQEALPDVDFVEVPITDNNKFAIMCDPRAILWASYHYEVRSEQILGRPAGDLQHYLFAEETIGSFNCFNRVIFKTA